MTGFRCPGVDESQTSIANQWHALIDSRESFAIQTPIFVARKADSHESLEFPMRVNHPIRAIRANHATTFKRKPSPGDGALGLGLETDHSMDPAKLPSSDLARALPLAEPRNSC